MIFGFRRKRQDTQAEQENGAHGYAGVTHRFGIIFVDDAGEKAERGWADRGDEATDVVAE